MPQKEVFVIKAIVAVLAVACAAGLHAQGLRLGVAAVDITPPVGAPMAGYYTPRFATGTHDALHSKAMVLEEGGVRIAMVACDLVSLPREISQQARSLIVERTGIPGDHVMISSTHAHTTPVIFTEPSRYNLQGEGKRIAQTYTSSLAEKLAASVTQAAAHTEPVTVRAAVGTEATTGFNRRYFMRDGSVGWNPGKLNPQIVRPAGPVDTAVPVIVFQSMQGTPVAAYVNFGLHQDTTGGLEFSADFSHTLAEDLAAANGPGFFTFFVAGAAGNVNHLDVSREGRQNGFAEAERIGHVLAGAVKTAIAGAQPAAVPAIGVSDRILQFPVPNYSAEEIAWAERTQASFGSVHPAPFLDLVKAARMLELHARNGKPLEAEVQVFTLGHEVAIAGFPGEMFAEFGIELREDSPFRVTVLAELSNGALTYIPNRIAYAEGNYEPTSARLPVGAGEQLLQSAQQQLLQLFGQQVRGSKPR